MRASGEGHLDIVLLLLAQGANMNLQDSVSYTWMTIGINNRNTIPRNPNLNTSIAFLCLSLYHATCVDLESVHVPESIPVR